MAIPLFRPFRALGYITDDVPFAIQRRGKETFVTVSVGKAWQVGGSLLHTADELRLSNLVILQIYNCAKLTLSLVGPQVRPLVARLHAPRGVPLNNR
jgi:U3 small nucleolar RNA-associated protein 21